MTSTPERRAQTSLRSYIYLMGLALLGLIVGVIYLHCQYEDFQGQVERRLNEINTQFLEPTRDDMDALGQLQSRLGQLQDLEQKVSDLLQNREGSFSGSAVSSAPELQRWIVWLSLQVHMLGGDPQSSLVPRMQEWAAQDAWIGKVSELYEKPVPSLMELILRWRQLRKTLVAHLHTKQEGVLNWQNWFQFGTRTSASRAQQLYEDILTLLLEDNLESALELLEPYKGVPEIEVWRTQVAQRLDCFQALHELEGWV